MQNHPDLIISDINRPGGNGYQFLEKLRSDSRTWDIPIFAISGSSRRADEELRQYRTGFDRVIAKPFKLDDLIEIINKFIMRHPNTNQALLKIETETPTLEYKVSIDISDKDACAGLAKDVIAMANIGGGTIIIGVAEPMKGRFEPVGLTSLMLEQLEVTSVNKALRSYIDPAIHVEVHRVADNDKTFIFLQIPGAEYSPILAKKNNQHVSLYQGRIYVRSSAAESREIVDYLELRQLLDRFRQKS